MTPFYNDFANYSTIHRQKKNFWGDFLFSRFHFLSYDISTYILPNTEGDVGNFELYFDIISEYFGNGFPSRGSTLNTFREQNALNSIFSALKVQRKFLFWRPFLIRPKSRLFEIWSQNSIKLRPLLKYTALYIISKPMQSFELSNCEKHYDDQKDDIHQRYFKGLLRKRERH